MFDLTTFHLLARNRRRRAEKEVQTTDAEMPKCQKAKTKTTSELTYTS